MVYKKTTNSIQVIVEPTFLDEHSEPEDNIYVWLYRVQISNLGRKKVYLKDRQWEITDALGRIYEVEGEGVMGEKPILHPGEAYEYTSGVPLPTPSGIMRGSYLMKTDQQEDLPVETPAFSLDSPYEHGTVN